MQARWSRSIVQESTNNGKLVKLVYICTTYHFKGKAENEQPGETSTLSCLYSYLKSTRLGSEQTQDINVIMFFHFLFLLKIKHLLYELRIKK